MKRTVLILVVGLTMAVPLGCCGFFGLVYVVGDPERMARIQSAREAARQGVEYPYGEEIRFGDLGLRITGGIGSWSATSGLGRQYDYNDHFVVKIKFKSHNPNRELKAGSQEGWAELTDDVGNTYAVMSSVNDLGFKNKIDGQIPKLHARSVRSDDDTAGDVLVFDKPLPGASMVKITLNAAAYGGQGRFFVVIPRSQWK